MNPRQRTPVRILLPDLNAEDAALLIDVLDRVVRALWDAYTDPLIDIYAARHKLRATSAIMRETRYAAPALDPRDPHPARAPR